VQRSLALAAVWLAAVAGAVGVGFLAVSLAEPSTSPAAPPGFVASPVATEVARSSAPPVPSGERSTPGGTVYASCVDGVAQLAGAPAPGWQVEQAADQVEFRDRTQKIEVRADCATGSPLFAVEGPRADDRGGDDGAPSSSARTPAPGTRSTAATVPTTAASSSADDHGGHGADDPPGDDHGGGRGGGDRSAAPTATDDGGHGGGHGSDD
jgi:hypothetical protein